MKRLCIIPCGAKKIWDLYPEAGETMAQSAYQSPFHRACQEYARTFFADWVILSAKHGFLLPETIVPANYDVAFGTNHPEMLTNEQLIRQKKEKRLDDFEEVVVLGGKKFWSIIEEVFPHQRAEYPLADCKGIGLMLQKLNQAVEQKKEIGV